MICETHTLKIGGLYMKAFGRYTGFSPDTGGGERFHAMWQRQARPRTTEW